MIRRLRVAVLGVVVLCALAVRPASAATVTWLSPVSGNWSDGTKWSGGVAPGSSDDAVINVAGTYTVTLDANATIQSLTLGGASGTQTLLINSVRTLTINGPGASSISANGLIDMSAGTITGTGNITLSGTMNWSGGTLSGASTFTVAGGAALNITGAVTKTISARTLDNSGAVTWSAGSINSGLAAVINNLTGGTFTIQGDNILNYNLGGTRTILNNSGTITKTTGTGTTTIEPVLNNNGTFDVQTGTLSLQGGGTHNGAFTVAGTITFSVLANTLSATSSLTGSGSAQFTGSTTTINGTYGLTGAPLISSGTTTIAGPISAFGSSISATGGTLNINTYPTASLTSLSITGGAISLNGGTPLTLSTVTLSNGTLSGSDNLTITTSFDWSGGTLSGTGSLTINAAAALNLTSVSTKTFSGRTINHAGTGVWSGGNFNSGQGAVFNNQSGATLTIQTDSTFNYNLGGTRTVLNNSGTITKSTTAGTTTIDPVLNNNGTVDVQTGTLSLQGGGTHNGAFTVAGTIVFSVLANTLSASSSLSGAGGAQFSSSTTTINGTYALAGSPLINGGTVTIAGPITAFGSSITASSGSLTLNTYPTATLTSLSISGGTVSLNGGTPLTLSTVTMSNGTLTGSDNITITTSFDWSAGTLSGSSTLTINSGAALNLTGSVAKTLSARTITNSGTTTWSGTGNINTGVGAVFNNQSGAAFNIQNDATFNFILGGTRTILNNSGTITKSPGTGTTTLETVVNNNGTIDVQTGTLALSGGGTSNGAFTVAVTITFSVLTHTLGASSSLTGTGSAHFQSGTTTISGTYGLSGSPLISSGTTTISGPITAFGSSITASGGTLNLSTYPTAALQSLSITGGTINLSGGTDLTLSTITMSNGTLTGTDDITVTTSFDWSGGTLSGASILTVNGGAALNMTGTNTKSLSARTLTNSGTAVWSGTGGFNSGLAAVFNNLAGATLTIQNDVVFNWNLGGTRTILNNLGTITKSPGTGTSTLDPTVNNDGTIDVQTGTLAFTGGGTANGTFTVSGAVSFSSVAYTFNAASTLTGTGSASFTSSTFTINGTYDLAGTPTFSGGTVTFAGPITDFSSSMTVSGGTVTFTTAPTATLNSVSVTSSGTLNYNAGTTLALNTLTFSGSTIGGTGPISVATSFTWSSGTLTGTGALSIGSGATFAITGSTIKTLTQRTINNAGTATWSGTGYLQGGTGAVFNNQATGSLTIQNDVYWHWNFGGTRTVINNSGTITKTAAGGTTNIEPALNNDGSVDVQSGTLSLEGGGTSNGSFTVASGQTLRFGGQTHTLNAAAGLSGAGSVVFALGTVVIDGTYALTGTLTASGATVTIAGTFSSIGTQVNVSNGTLTINSASVPSMTNVALSGGTLGGSSALTVTGVFDWTSGTLTGTGTLTLSGGSTLSLSGPGVKSLSQRTINHAGTATWTGTGYIQSGIGAIFNNQSGATFTIQNDVQWYWNLGGTRTVINNAGTLTKNTTTGTTSIDAALNNTNAVSVQSGTLALEGGGNSTGSYAVASGAILRFAVNAQTFGASSTFTGAGDLAFAGNTHVFSGTYSVTGTATVSSGTWTIDSAAAQTLPNVALSGGTLNGTAPLIVSNSFNWTSGTLSGSSTLAINAGALLNINGSGVKSFSQRTINHAGTASWSGTGNIQSGGGAVFNNQNGATFTILNDTTFDFNLGGTRTILNNAGTITKTAGAGTTTIDAVFNNDSVVNVLAGTLSLAGGGTSNGSFSFSNGTTLRFSGLTHTLNASSTVTGGGNSLFATGTIVFNGTYDLAGTMTNSGATTTIAGTVSSIGSPVTVSSGTLTINSASVPTLTNVALSGGTLGGTSALAVSGTFDWTSGTLTGTGTLAINSGGALNVTGAGVKTLTERTVNHAGTAVWSGTGYIQGGIGAVFNNQLGATFSIQNDAGWFYNFGGTRTIVNNAGTFTKSSGAGITTFDAALNNDSVFNIQSGTLSVDGGGTSNGTFNVDAGRTLRFAGQPYTLAASSVLAGGGDVTFQSNTITFNGTYSLTGTATVAGSTLTVGSAAAQTFPTIVFTNGTLNGTGTIIVSSAFNWATGTLSGAGVLTINSGAAFNLTGAGVKTFTERTINNAGTMTWSGTGYIQGGLGSVFNNQSGGAINIQNDNFWYFNFGGTRPALNNSGTITKSIGTGTTTIEAALANSNSVDIQSGTLELNGGGSSSGTFTVAAGATFRVNALTTTLAAGSNLTGAGNLSIGNGTLVVAGAYTLTGTANLTSGGGTLTVNSATTQTAANIILTSGTINGTGHLAVSGALDWASGTINGAGALTINSGAALNVTGSGVKTFTERTINNAGTTTWSGTGYIQGGLGAVFNNLAGGTFNIQNDNNWYYNFGGTLTAFNNQGTLLKSAGTGTSPLGVNLNNAGLVDLQTGILNAANGYTQTSAGTLRLRIGGLTVGTQFARLQVSGTANLAGTIDTDLAIAYSPSNGDTFQVVTFTNRNGDFATKDLLYPGGGFAYALNATNITLTASTTGISISKSGPASLDAAQPITYTITVSNAGPDPGSTVQMTDTLPNGVTFGSITPAAGWNCGNTNPVVCTIASMPIGNAIFTLNATAPNDGGSINNIATVSATNDPDTSNNSANAVTTVNAITDLAISLTADASVSVGSNVTYVATVENFGPSTATGVSATLQLSAGMTAASITPTAGNCNGLTTSTVICTYASLGAAQQETITVVSVANSGGTQTANASITAPQTDTDLSNNNDFATTTVTGATTLTVINSNAAGPGSLASAISDANGGLCGALCTIAFNIGAPAPIPGPMPTITTSVIIDGTTQPGYVNAPVIAIDGSSATPGSSGLTLASSGSTIRGLAVHGFASGNGISLQGSGGHTVELSRVGLTTTNSAAGNGTGIAVTSGGNKILTSRVANNIGTGVSVAGVAGNGILGTTFTNNGGLAIDLDATANNGQAPPLLTDAVLGGGNVHVGFTANAATPASTGSMTLQLFVADGGGEGTTFVGSACLAGNAFAGQSVTMAAPGLTPGTQVVATITAHQGASCGAASDGTSEFSAAIVTTGCAPPPATISSAPAVCTSSTGNVASVPATAGATYAWTIANGTITGGATSNAISFTAGASGSVSLGVTVSHNGCTNNDTHVVPISIVSPTITPSGPTTFCTGGSVNLTASAGSTYLWSPTNETTQQITVTASGNYSVTVTDANGCVGTSAPVTVTVNTPPPTAIFAPSSVCSATANHAASVTNTAGASYTWTITGGAITGGQGTSAITFDVPPASPGVTLSVSATANGCTANGSTNVSVTPTPSAALTAPAAVCPDSSGNTASVPATAGATYLWNVTNATIDSGAGTNSITFTAGSSGNVHVGVTVSAASCSATSSQSIAINAAPTASIIAPPFVCASAPGNNASVPAQTGASYAWSITNGTITGGAGTNAITFTAGASGNVVLNVTTTVGTCTTNGSSTIPIAAPPSSTITAPATLCPSGTGVASVPASAGASYNWSITGGTINAGQGTESITFTAGTSGNVVLGVAVSVGACSSNGAHTTTINPLPPATITAPSAVCPNTTGNAASVAATAGAAYTWSVTGGLLTGGQGTNSITFTAGPGGSVAINVNVVVGSCGTTGSHNAAITASPDVTITAPPGVCPSSTGNAASVPATAGATYNWTITGGTITAGQNTNAITFSAAASGSVVLGVTVTSGSCSATGSHTAPINAAPTITVTAPPNVCALSTNNAASATQVAGATYVWTITGGTITAGQNTSAITFTAGASGNVVLNVTATVNGCASSGTATTPITPSPSATITAPSQVNANSGGHNASVPLQAGATYAWQITNGSVTGGQGTNAITFSAGSSGSVALKATVTLSGCTTIGTHNVAIEGSQPADLAIDKSGPASVTTGGSIVYTLTVTNNGPAAAASVVVSDTLPGSMSLGTVTATGVTCSSSLLTVTCTAPSLAAGASATITINATAPSSATTVTNTASVASQAVDPTSGNNSDSVTTAVNAPSPTCPTTPPSLIAPTGGTHTAPITFTWSAVPQAVGYRVVISVGDDAPQELGATDGATSLTASVPPGLITWRVDALFPGCPAVRSQSATFTVVAETCQSHGRPTLVEPLGGTHDGEIHFDWTAVANADGYRVWISVDNGAFLSLGTTLETEMTELVPPGTIRWYAEALFDGCSSTESDRATFTVAAAQNCGNDRPTLVSPSNVTLTNANVTFSWNSVANAVAYELWLALDNGTPTLLATTQATSLTREVPPGELEWFVRALFNGCPARESQHAHFTYEPPAECTATRPLLIAPADDVQSITSPATFRWSAVHGATRYELYVGQGNSTPSLVRTVTTNVAEGVELQNGAKRWFVRAFFGGNCPSLDSTTSRFVVVPQPAACSPLAQPVLSAPGTISSNVGYTIQWAPVPGATGYTLQRSTRSDFVGADSTQTTASQANFTDANNGTSPISRYYRVRANDSRCNPATQSAFSSTLVVVILPNTSNDASTLATSPQSVTYTIPLGPELAGQSFEATTTRPWLTVTPSSGVVPAGGTTLSVSANTSGLPLGANLGAVNLSLTTPTLARVAGHGTTVKTTTISVSLVTPVSETPKSTPPPDALIIPAVAHADGINSKFQSDVRVTNTSPQVMKYQLTFTPSGDEGMANGKQTTIEVEPGRTVALDDVLESWFGGAESQATTGTLEVRPLTETSNSTSSSAQQGIPNFVTFAASRTFNATANGTFGQYIPAIPYANFIGRSGDALQASALSLQQIAHSAQYRTNLGFVEGSGQDASLAVSVFGSNGVKLTEFPVELRGGQHLQMNSFLADRGITMTDGRVEVRVTSETGRVTAYASVLDNNTADPLLVSPVALGQSGSSKFVLPGVADINNGIANWRTDMRLFNAGADPVNATLTFYSMNPGEAPRTTELTLEPHAVRELDATLANVFGVTNNGGAVHIDTTQPANLVATARTYNQTTTGTFGQFISAVTPNEAASLGSRPLQLLQVEESDRYRSNIGIAEVTGKPAKVEITVVPPDSRLEATIETDIAPNEFRQLNSLLEQMGLDNTYNARVTVKVIEGDGRVTAYASVIDTLTQDPTFVPAQ